MIHDPATCVTCGDVAVLGRVLVVNESTAVVDVDGQHERVGVELVEPVCAGDLLLCHAGIAISLVEEAPR